jgi:hypothetical protein
MARERRSLVKHKEIPVAVENSSVRSLFQQMPAIYLVESLLVIVMLAWVSFLSWGGIHLVEVLIFECLGLGVPVER